MATAYELFSRVRQHYTGAQGHFVISRVQLKSGVLADVAHPGNRDPEIARRIEAAIREICPDVLEQTLEGSTE